MYNKTKPIDTKEFDFEKNWWKTREENESAWKVSIDEIKQRNYNLDIKNPHADEEQQSYTSSELFELLDKSFSHSHDLLQQLKQNYK